jgi:hypothetical protein
MTGVRAEPLAAHSVEMAELELYLAATRHGHAAWKPQA